MAHTTFHHLHAPRTHWWFVFAGGVVTLVGGTIGFMLLEAHEKPESINNMARLPGAIYGALQMLILHTPHVKEPNIWIEIGRWSGAATVLATTWFLLWKRLRHEFREISHRFWRGHTVICGLGDRGYAIARNFMEKRRANVVIIDPMPDEDKMVQCERRGMFVIVGDATDPGTLRRSGVGAAAEIMAVTDSDETNVRIGLAVNALVAAGGEFPKRCRVHLSDINLREILQRAATRNAGAGQTAVEFFDVFEQEAQRILNQQGLTGGETAKADTRCTRLVILGFGRMGRSVALQASKTCPQPLRIVVIDRKGDAQRERFLFRHPGLADKLEFVSAEAESAQTRRLIEDYAQDRATSLHVFVCVDENKRAVEISLRLREVLAKCPDCTLAVRIKSRASLGAIFDSTDTGANSLGPKIVAFGMVEDWAASNA